MPGGNTPKNAPPTATSQRFTRVMQTLSEQLEDADASRTEELNAHADGNESAYNKAFAQTSDALGLVRRTLQLLGNGKFDKVERDLGTNSWSKE